MNRVTLGIETLSASPPPGLKKQRLGLLCNSASVGGDLIHGRQLIHAALGERLKVLFSPQHGLFAEKQDNMIESNHRRDPLLEIPVYSLYSRARIPTREMFSGIDVLLVDLQDVGTRVYTFIYTLSYCMQAAEQYGKKVVVLDRPNPIGGLQVEGNCLSPQYSSFVGRYPIPMRHGLTIGELARLFNAEFGIGCHLEVLPMRGWRREMYFADTGLPWVAPSPNLPTPVSALVYPGQVIIEGTNLSEGRGTTQPFELCGAPYLDQKAVLNSLAPRHTEGAYLRPVEFEPTANKWKAEICQGFQIHVMDPRRFRPYRTSLALLRAIMASHADHFQWKQPPYEYEFERLPIDLILGERKIRQQLEAGLPLEEMETDWQHGLHEFEKLRHNYLLYP